MEIRGSNRRRNVDIKKKEKVEEKQKVQNQLGTTPVKVRELNQKLWPESGLNKNSRVYKDIKCSFNDYTDINPHTIGGFKVNNYNHKPLLILELQGVLIDMESNFGKLIIPTNAIRFRTFDVWIRPYFNNFLNFCLENFNVVMWTVLSENYTNQIIKHIITKNQESRIIGFLPQAECKKIAVEGKQTPVFCKDLVEFWKTNKQFNRGNTLVIDCEQHRLEGNLNQCYRIANPWKRTFKEDIGLSSDGIIRKYLQSYLDQWDLDSKSLFADLDSK